jgi:methylated-DNA-protein-cysteine methyltransferase-like protein
MTKPALNPEPLLTVLAQVPPGSVIAFGELATMAGFPGKARWAGRVLSQLPSSTTLPWHRVVNASGVLTCPRSDLAAARLEREGVRVHNGRVAMGRYNWNPAGSAAMVGTTQQE